MNLFQSLLFTLVKFLKVLHAFSVRLILEKVKLMVTKKLSEIGLEVVMSEGKCDILEKELTHYETSKAIGSKPTLTIYNDKFFDRLCIERGLGFGESYLDGWWDCDRLDELGTIFYRADMNTYMEYLFEKIIFYLEHEVLNLQTSEKAYEVAEGHYDLGDFLFESFLDPSMTYTCAYWRNASNLAEAQQHKMDLIARKLKLKPGMRVLELGCGWGGLAQFLAENYKVSVVACNIAKEGARSATERCRGLDVEIRNCDYRDIDEKFDRVVAVGLMEHVGPQNYKTFMEVAHRCLDDHGIFLTHTIGCDNDNNMKRCEPFSRTLSDKSQNSAHEIQWDGDLAPTNRLHKYLSKYIFPNGMLPRATEITTAISGLFTLEDWQNFGNDYSKTLMAWYGNFIKSWPDIKHRFKDPSRFYRLWTLYLLMSAGAFKSRKYQLWQVCLSKNGLPGGYESVR